MGNSLKDQHYKNMDITLQMDTLTFQAESIAYTVCQHFGIDTSEYSFGYIAGWSSGKDMRELKSSLDTIRRTASELITGIEGQLKEIQRDREMMQEQEKENLLLIQNSDLSEYSLVNVRGMDAAEVVEALTAMNDNDRLNIAAYLESRGAWITEIADVETRELDEYSIDVRYITDTNEIVELKAEMETDERTKEPIGKDDGILKATSSDRFDIYQLKDNPELRNYHFVGTAELLKRGILSDDFREIQPENYNLVYTGAFSDIHGHSQMEKLGAVYEKFNIDRPEDFKGHSLSVSDIVVMHENGKDSAHFVDSFGFTELPEFIRELEGAKDQKAQKPELKENHTFVYRESWDYAVNHGEVDKYHESHKLDWECKEAIEETIRENFDGMFLNHDIVKPLAERYGSERMAFVLANTIRQKPWDGRFSRDNKAWASEHPIIENIVHGTDMNNDLIVTSHPAVLDGFIDMFRKEVLDREKELSVGQEKVTSGHDVQKPGAEQTIIEQPKPEQAQSEHQETRMEPNEPEKAAETPGVEDMEDGDEIIDLGDCNAAL